MTILFVGIYEHIESDCSLSPTFPLLPTQTHTDLSTDQRCSQNTFPVACVVLSSTSYIHMSTHIYMSTRDHLHRVWCLQVLWTV